MTLQANFGVCQIIHSLMPRSSMVPCPSDLTTPSGMVFLSTEFSQVLSPHMISFKLLYYKLFQVFLRLYILFKNVLQTLAGVA